MNPLKPTGHGPISVLVVDDHPNLATTLARAISQLGDGIEVIAADSGEKALQLVKDKNVDLLITDMVMPGITGLELIEKMQRHPGGRPSYVALITAYDVPGLKETARRMKVNDVINKPIRPERLCQIVSKAIEDLGHTASTAEQEVKPQMKILVADDQQDNVTLLSRYLENEGYTCISASDGEQTLDKMRAEMPDLVLLDVNMPVKDGFQALQEIRSDATIGHIPVIFITAARLEPMDLQYALSIGADDYVTKPFDRRELLARIRTRLRVKETEDIIRRRNKELSLLQEIGRELSARLDEDELTDLVLRRTVETLGALLGHIILLTPEGTRHKSYHFSPAGTQPSEMAIPPMTELLSQITDTRQGIIISDARKDARWQVAPDDPTRALVIAPMFGRLDLLGLLVLVHETPGYFVLEHKLLLQAIASQAAIAMENARLYSGVAQEQQRMAAILQSAADPIFLFDAEGHLTLQNPAGESLLDGFEKPDSQPLQGIGYQPFDELLLAALKTGQSQKGEFLWPDQRLFAARFTPVEAGGCVAILYDVSRFMVLEQAKNQFIADASHSLKNPLTKIKLIAGMIGKTGPLNEKQIEYVKVVNGAADAMDRVIQNMLELVRLDSDNPDLVRETVSMNQIVSGITAEFQKEAGARELSLKMESDRNEPQVMGVPFLLQQALRNLVSNAIRYSPANGTILLTVQSDRDGVQVSVKDSGYGIPAKDLPFIFERFYRVQDDSTKDIEGSGLGLAIVKSIVERHGGNVKVESEVGKGSFFMISLPRVWDQEPANIGTALGSIETG